MKNIEKIYLANYDKYAKAIFRHIYYRVSSESLAQDLTQEAFFKAWRYIANGGEVDNYKALFYRIANNLIIDYYRRKEKIPLSIDDVAEKNLSYKGDQEKKMDEFFHKKTIAKLLSKLETEPKQIIIYRYIDGLGVKEISKIINKSPNNISVIIHRSLKELKKHV